MGEVQRTKNKSERTNKDITKHKEKIVEKIKQDKGGKELWKNIRKIGGKEVKKKELKIYDEDGKELEEIEAEKRIERFWKQTYQTHQNKTNDYSNQVVKETYEREIGENRRTRQRRRNRGSYPKNSIGSI